MWRGVIEQADDSRCRKSAEVGGSAEQITFVEAERPAEVS
jgi:hypothetical protein